MALSPLEKQLARQKLRDDEANAEEVFDWRDLPEAEQRATVREFAQQQVERLRTEIPSAVADLDEKRQRKARLEAYLAA